MLYWKDNNHRVRLMQLQRLALQPSVTESTPEPLVAKRRGCFSDWYLTATAMHSGRRVSHPGHNSKGKLFTCTSSEAACNSYRLGSYTALNSKTSFIFLVV